MLFISSIDSSNLGKYNKNFKVNFTVSDNFSKNAWAVPRKGKSKKTTTAFREKEETSIRKRQKCGLMEVKSFLKKHFWIFLNEMEHNFIQLTQIWKLFLLNVK